MEFDFKKTPAYYTAETEFLRKYVNIRDLLDHSGFKARPSGTSIIHTRGDLKISTRVGSNTGNLMWLVSGNSEEHGGLTEFIMFRYKISDRKAAWEKVKELAETYWGIEYSLFIQNFERNFKPDDANGATYAPKKTVRFKPFNLIEYRQEPPSKPTRDSFPFVPAENFDFLLDRRITLETITHPLFKGRLGNTTGAFGADEVLKGTFKPEDFEFLHHITIPYYLNGVLVGLEAKNRLTEAAFHERIDQAINRSKDPNKVRRNPSKFYGESSREGAWISAIPDKPQAIFLCEQPADALTYFQINKENPLTERTIYITTGGGVLPGHFALLHELISKYGINRIILGWDQDTAGIKYALKTIQNLPFNEVDKQDYNLLIRDGGKQYVEFDFLLKDLSIPPEKMRDAVGKIEDALKTKYKFEGEFEILPALVKDETLCTIRVPYTEANSYEIIRLGMRVMRTADKIFTIDIPSGYNDWNDKLMDKPMLKTFASSIFLDQKETRHLIHLAPDNTILYHRQFKTLDHNVREPIGQVKPFDSRGSVRESPNLIKYSFVERALSEFQAKYDEMIPFIDGRFAKRAVRRGISYSPLEGTFTRGGQIIARWNGGRAEFVTNENASEDTRKVVRWMTEAILNGRDPNSIDLVVRHNQIRFGDSLAGTINQSFVFERDEHGGFVEQTQSWKDQLDLFLGELSIVQQKWRHFRELYPEPIPYITSSNLVLFEDQTPLVQFDPDTNTIRWLPKINDLESRSFNPFFFKALQLFIENQGVFYNYIRSIRISHDTNTLFFGSPGHEIGRLVSYGNEMHLALFPEIPASMKDELRAFSPYPEASAELIERLGIRLEPSGLNAKIKGAHVNTVPYQYSRFFDAQGKKFIPKADSEIKAMSHERQKLYSEAWVWHMNNNASKLADATDSVKDRIYEREGTIYFNRIVVAKLNVEQHVLETLVPSSSKFYQHLAIIERNLVSDPANRKFSEYLFKSADQPAHRHVMRTELDTIQRKITKDTQTGELKIVDKNFLLQTIGVVTDNVAVMDEQYLRYSDVFRDAIIDYAQRLGVALEWRSMQPASAMPLDAARIIDVVNAEQKSFEHDLRSTPSGVLQTILDAPAFRDKIDFRDEKIAVKFLPGQDGQLVLPLETAWHTIKDRRYWMSCQPENPRVLVLAQDPRQALLYYQHNFLESIHSREVYVSTFNLTDTQRRRLVEQLMTTYGMKELRLVGDSGFLTTAKNSLASIKNIGMMSIPLLVPDQTTAKVKKLISPIEPDVRLQRVIDGLSGYNMANPAEGVIVFPVSSNTSSSRATLGKTLYNSSDQDSLWFSQPLKRASKVVLTINVDEAIHYMHLNRSHIHNTAIIAFQGTVTNNQVKHLTDLLKNGKFFNRVAVANTGGLIEKLLEKQFQTQFRIEKPFSETTFRAECRRADRLLELAKQDIFNTAKRRALDDDKLGKTNAPVVSSTSQRAEREVSQRRVVK